MKHSILEAYGRRFEGSPLIVRSPGRVNLIGEHTDYNMGLVLPASIDRELLIAMGKNPVSGQIHIYAADHDEEFCFSTRERYLHSKTSWINYISALVIELEERGYRVEGFEAVFGGNIPIGAGLSSSAALCCGFIYGLSALFDFRIEREEIALIAQAAEHRTGCLCGLMDQYAVLFGKEEQAILLNCDTLDFKYVPVILQDYKLLLINSGIKHALSADSGYNERRRSCERVVEKMKYHVPGLRHLSELDTKILESHKSELAPSDYLRAGYVMDENGRVIEAVRCLREGNMEALGALLFSTHLGLRDAYEVSIRETDLLVDLAMAHPGVLGARMIGGGFGGCTLNLIQSAEREDIIEKVVSGYMEGTGIDPEVIGVKTAPGVSIIQNS